MPETMITTGELTPRDRWDHFLARVGYRRMYHRVRPGLYRLGRPTPGSPVVVSANYTLSFDALRSALRGADAFILVLDTHGVGERLIMIHSQPEAISSNPPGLAIIRKHNPVTYSPEFTRNTGYGVQMVRTYWW